MEFILTGGFSFILFYLFDYFNMKGKVLYKIACAFSGLVLIIYSTINIPNFNKNYYIGNSLRNFFLLLSLIFLFLLIYSLFLELPFSKTYGGKKYNDGLVDTGTYALCRHPGVLWFFFMYLFYALYTESVPLLMAGLIWTSLDVIYVVLQEKYFFIKIFKDYEEYKKSTPMLIPNVESWKRCFKTIK